MQSPISVGDSFLTLVCVTGATVGNNSLCRTRPCSGRVAADFGLSLAVLHELGGLPERNVTKGRFFGQPGAFIKRMRENSFLNGYLNAPNEGVLMPSSGLELSYPITTVHIFALVSGSSVQHHRTGLGGITS